MFVCVNPWPRSLPPWLALVTIVVAITAATAVTTPTATTSTTVTTPTTATTVSSRLGFVDGQIAAAKVLAVKCLDCCCCLFRGCHFHKSKAA